MSNFADPQFGNEEDLIESLLASYKMDLRSDLDTMLGSRGALSEWVLNSNYNIVMPPYRPLKVDLKGIVPRGK